MQKSKETIQNDLNARITRCSAIINGLENYEPFKMFLDDFKAQKDLIDNNWHLITDEKQLMQFRVTKFATLSLLDSIENYKHDLKKCQQDLTALLEPDKVQGSYYDHE